MPHAPQHLLPSVKYLLKKRYAVPLLYMHCVFLFLYGFGACLDISWRGYPFHIPLPFFYKKESLNPSVKNFQFPIRMGPINFFFPKIRHKLFSVVSYKV